ncbi:LysR family transcriptional regulator [Fusibacter ferrireducens]|uniref:LysR family transcriptional regulator n=1 Tax=Fusibacter ferrireducens TaxID=2785058 RepID=A0ABR9ZSX4_9FIRM|nr:LysR family transcriptional regulator [Fusibacter ferrireducens]MBF4693456.1 LysR family transcriptional regulator [Fusibacter ferrireducens]
MTHLEIDAFLAVIQYGSITKAAEALFVTQPALSRRIKVLEKELGYELFLRQKGIRSVEITDSGRHFIPIAEQWKHLWMESLNVPIKDNSIILNVSSLDSVSTYIMPWVCQSFLRNAPGMNLTIRTLHSFEAYEQLENGLIDLAFISDQMFSRHIETIPAYEEEMLFVCSESAAYPQVVHPSDLDASKQIKLPWNPEYEMWHEYWFGSAVKPRVFLDKMSLMEHFLILEESWAIVPASAATQLSLSEKIKIHQIKDGPTDKRIYYLLGRKRKMDATHKFLEALDAYIATQSGIQPLLKLK